MYFTKMHGCGNDFIVINDLENKLNNLSELASKLCHRNFGIGADGIICVKRSSLGDIRMEIINADGSYAAMCGNGIRCFAKYLWEKDIVKKDKINIETGDGIKIAHLNINNNKLENVTINMGSPEFEPDKIPSLSSEKVIDKAIEVGNKKYNITSLLMGVPHTVVFGKLNDFNVEEGKVIEKYNLFPQGTNVNFVEIVSREEIRVMTWERGAGATMACGTGSCASVVAGNTLNLLGEKVKVHVPGGILQIEIQDNKVLMTGSAEISFEGVCEI
ncbi:diaminopimelate epimerase [Haloimpatiens lingqiaonensis]|uniref:diaminopimelate epimerase n=1 Tax=Haloimpatiens lingqiaonensis TaxID=1380675 RepID=UPI0010FD74BF|nr:diaminopimelate epimerase [Haloimpatiens lingqiaonensis]